jgi:hypothetical protein
MKTTVLEDKLFKMLKDNLADLWQDDLISEAGKSLRNSNPCWKGYHPVGTKKKGGKTVPNCVPSESVAEGWSQKYKSSINCSHPKGFSQKAHCAGKKKHNEDMSMEAVCPDCGMCKTHGNMSLNEIKKGQKDSNGFTKCWPGKHAEGTKKGRNGGQVRNCVPNESQGVAEGSLNEFAPDGFNGGDDGEEFNPRLAKMAYDEGVVKGVSLADGATLERAMAINDWDKHDGGIYRQYFAKGFKAGRKEKIRHGNKQYNLNLQLMKDGSIRHGEQGVAEDWNKVNHHDKTNGLSQKAVNAYRRENPGSKLQTAVTTKPSKLKKGSKAAKRRKSFCARMSGNKGPMKKPNGKPTPKALALRRWNCESLDQLYITANQHIYEAEGEPEGLKHLTPHLAKDILDQIETEGVHAIVKSIEWGDGGAKELIAMIKRDLEQIANNASESITTNDIHALADSKGVKWDNEPNFLKLTKRLTGKEHLDDLDQSGLHKVKQHLESMNAKMQENFADGKHPEDKGDSARAGIPKHASISTLKKIAHQGGRKGQLAHWQANMRSGRNK